MSVPVTAAEPKLKPTAQRVLNALVRANSEGRTDGWCCSRSLHHPKVGGWRFGARLHEIRQAGIRLEKRVCACDQCRYHKTRIIAWRLVPLSGESPQVCDGVATSIRETDS